MIQHAAPDELDLHDAGQFTVASTIGTAMPIIAVLVGYDVAAVEADGRGVAAIAVRDGRCAAAWTV